MERKTKRHLWIKLVLSALVPLMIGVFTVITTIQQQNLSNNQRKQDKKEALLVREQSERQANNLHEDNLLTIYFDDISKLVMSNNEKNSLNQIRVKTLSTLRQLDFERKKHLFLFLYDNELISNRPNRSISSLLNINGADLSGIHFQKSSETDCTFLYLYLYRVHLSNASFINCYIDHSNFSYSTMYKTIFFQALLMRISFKFTLLNKASFSRAKLFQVNFTGASLTDCNFTGVFWRNMSVDFTNANLTGAILSDEQLLTSIVDNSILPNGTWGPIRTENLIANGDAEINNTANSTTNVTDWWYVSVPGIISIVAYDKKNFTQNFDGKSYHFRVTPSYTLNKSVSMSQHISLDKYTLLISSGIARFNFSINAQCQANQYVNIELTFSDMYDLKYSPIYRDIKSWSQIDHLTISKMMDSEIRRFRIKIGFIKDNEANTTVKENYCIVDNIQFSIIKD